MRIPPQKLTVSMSQSVAEAHHLLLYEAVLEAHAQNKIEAVHLRAVEMVLSLNRLEDCRLKIRRD